MGSTGHPNIPAEQLFGEYYHMYVEWVTLLSVDELEAVTQAGPVAVAEATMPGGSIWSLPQGVAFDAASRLGRVIRALDDVAYYTAKAAELATVAAGQEGRDQMWAGVFADMAFNDAARAVQATAAAATARAALGPAQ